MSIVMLNAYNSLGNNFNEFLKFLKIKHNDNEWFLKAMQNSKVIKFIPGFHDQVYIEIHWVNQVHMPNRGKIVLNGAASYREPR